MANQNYKTIELTVGKIKQECATKVTKMKVQLDKCKNEISILTEKIDQLSHTSPRKSSTPVKTTKSSNISASNSPLKTAALLVGGLADVNSKIDSQRCCIRYLLTENHKLNKRKYAYDGLKLFDAFDPITISASKDASSQSQLKSDTRRVFEDARKCLVETRAFYLETSKLVDLKTVGSKTYGISEKFKHITRLQLKDKLVGFNESLLKLQGCRS